MVDLRKLERRIKTTLRPARVLVVSYGDSSEPYEQLRQYARNYHGIKLRMRTLSPSDATYDGETDLVRFYTGKPAKWYDGAVVLTHDLDDHIPAEDVKKGLVNRGLPESRIIIAENVKEALQQLPELLG